MYMYKKNAFVVILTLVGTKFEFITLNEYISVSTMMSEIIFLCVDEMFHCHSTLTTCILISVHAYRIVKRLSRPKKYTVRLSHKLVVCRSN